MRKRLTIRFSGTVQGVGFRYTTRRLADHYSALTGTVRNMPDGTVEVIAEAEEADLTAFADAIAVRMAGYIHTADRDYTNDRNAFVAFRIVD